MVQSPPRHEESKCHKEAYDMIVTIRNTVQVLEKYSLLSIGRSNIKIEKLINTRNSMMSVRLISFSFLSLGVRIILVNHDLIDMARIA